jgi:hypothetical protein
MEAIAMFAWLLPALTKLVWWLIPQLAAFIVDGIGKCLLAVEQAESIENLAERRLAAMNALGSYSMIPEPIRRFTVEACVILFKLGITAAHLEKMESLVAREETWADVRTSEDRRYAVLMKFRELFPNLPERMGRLLLEIAVLKIKAAFSSGKEAVQNRTEKLDEEGNFGLAPDGCLVAHNDGEEIITDKGEVLRFSAADEAWLQAARVSPGSRSPEGNAVGERKMLHSVENGVEKWQRVIWDGSVWQIQPDDSEGAAS